MKKNTFNYNIFSQKKNVATTEVTSAIQRKGSNLYKNISTAEKSLIFTILSILLIIKIAASFYLNRIGVFDQYNVFFDADPNQYVSAISNGWGFGRDVHPAFGLLLNVPVRALDYLATHLGLIKTNAIRDFAPIIISPLLNLVSGIFWWLAACRSGFSAPARIGGLLFSQFAFSQTVFSVLPESYAVSGALLSILLFLSVRAIQDPLSLDTNRTRIRWLALACLMSGITITNGLLCVLVWFSICFKRGQLRRVIIECLVAVAILICAITTMTAADRLVYTIAADGTKPEQSQPEAIKSFAQRYMFESIINRAVAMPASFIASVFPGNVETIPNILATKQNHYQYEFSLNTYSKSPALIFVGWLIIGVSFIYFIYVRSIPKVFQVVFAVLIFNGAIHSLFGREIFLYSQHWISFLTFGIIFPISNKVSWRPNVLLLTLVLLSLVLSLYAWSGMLSILKIS